MALLRLASLFGLIGLWATPAAAQPPGVVVQLPTFSFFTVSTTVSIPDSGGAFIGGNRQASRGYTSFGPAWLPPGRATGKDRRAGGAHVSAQIHDFKAMDDELLAESSQENESPADLAPRFKRRLAMAGESSAGKGPPGSLADARRMRLDELAAQEQNLQDEIARADKAFADGKLSVAKYHLQFAARRASGKLKVDLEARLTSLRTQMAKKATRRK